MTLKDTVILPLPKQGDMKTEVSQGVLIWWDKAQQSAKVFFDTVQRNDSQLPHAELPRLLAELEQAYDRIDSGGFPTSTFNACSHLLTAMENLIQGVVSAIEGQNTASHTYLVAARIETGCLYSALDKLGIQW